MARYALFIINVVLVGMNREKPSPTLTSYFVSKIKKARRNGKDQKIHKRIKMN